MFEAQGSQGFVGLFMYEEVTGKPVWYAATGDLSTDSGGRPVFDGTLLLYRGGLPLTSSVAPFSASTSVRVGEVRISFQGHQATVTLPSGRTMQATRFDIAGSGYDFDHPVPTTQGQPEVGWYWNRLQGGRGYAIEVQNNRAFVAMFHYNEDGSPTWNVVDVDLSSIGPSGGRFKRYSGGQTLYSAYRAPRSDDLGRFSLSFNRPCSGLVQFEDLQPVPVDRFRFGVPGLPVGEECRSVTENRFPMPNGLTAQPTRLQPGELAYGYLRSHGDVHVYAVTVMNFDSFMGNTAIPELLGATAFAGTLTNPVVRVFKGNGVSGGSFSGTQTFFVAVSAGSGSTGSYRLRVTTFENSRGYANSTPSHYTRSPAGSKPTGHYTGTLTGATPAELDLTLDPVGQAAGTLSVPQPAGANATLIVSGSVRADGTLQLAAGPGSHFGFSGFVTAAGVISGVWRDAFSLSDGLFLARRVPPSTPNSAPLALIYSASSPRVLTGVPESYSGLGSSDANGDVLIHSWQVLSAPIDSNVISTLVGADTAIATFTADVAGTYQIGLTVDDGRGGIASTVMTITADAAPVALPPP